MKLLLKGVCSPLYLSPEEVEVLCRCGGVSNVHVDTVSIHSPLIAVTQLEESLNSARGVLRPGSIVAMGEQHHQTTLE